MNIHKYNVLIAMGDQHEVKEKGIVINCRSREMSQKYE